jgi:hypothetical protein
VKIISNQCKTLRSANKVSSTRAPSGHSTVHWERSNKEGQHLQVPGNNRRPETHLGIQRGICGEESEGSHHGTSQETGKTLGPGHRKSAPHHLSRCNPAHTNIRLASMDRADTLDKNQEEVQLCLRHDRSTPYTKLLLCFRRRGWSAGWVATGESRNRKSELLNGRGAHFQNEHIAPDTFDSLYLQIMAEDKWQERWTNSEKGRITYEFLPTVTTDPEQLPHLTWNRTQVLTGHGEFGCHLLRIGKREDDLSETCEDESDDPRHCILHSPRYLMAQEAINEELRSCPPSMQEVPFLEGETIFDLLISQNPSTEFT